MTAPALLRAGRAAATTAGHLRLRQRRLGAAVLVAVDGDAAGRDGHEAELVGAIVAALSAGQGSTTARMRAAVAAADGALRARSAGRPAPLTAAVALVVADEAEVVVAAVGSVLAFASTPDGLPAALEARPPSGAWSDDGDPARPPLGRPGALEPIIRWWRFEPAAFPRGLAVVAATLDAGDALSDGVVGALYATPLERWPGALTAAVPLDAAAVAVGFAAPTAASQRPPRRDAAAGSTPIGAAGRAADGRGAVDRAAAPSARAVATSARIADEMRGAAGRARLAAAAVPWRRYGAAAGRGVARLFLALFPRRLSSRDPAEWATLLATAAVLLPLAAIVAALAILARAPGGLGAGVDRARRDAAPAATALPAAPIQIAPPAGDGAVGAASVVSAPVPVATLAPHDPTFDTGMIRLPDAAGIARLQGGEHDGRRVVAVGATAYVLNVAARVVDAATTAGVLPVLQSGTAVGGQPVGDLLDLAWLPLASGDGGQVVALDAAGRLWAIDGVAARPLAVTGGLAEGTRVIGGYDGNLYGIDRAHGITRYAPAQGPSFAAGAAWLDAPADLADAVDIAVDGSVFVLRAGGAIARFADGGSAPFAADAVPGGLSGAAALYGSATAGRLLVADAARGRIVALAADGAFTAQHALPILPAAEAGSDAAAGRITALQGLFWDEAEDALWWLSGPELYRARFRP